MAYIEKYKFKNICGKVYTINKMNSIESALRWVINCSKKSGLDGFSVDLDDGLSYHDGTISRSISFKKIAEQEDEVVEEYKDKPLTSISLSAYYKKKFFDMRINLDDYSIHLGCNEERMVDFEALEQLFGLLD